MIFHGYFRSSSAYRCRIAFNLKAVTPEEVYVPLREGRQRSAEYLALNPQGLVPALETDAGAVLTQSLAILEWLDEMHPEPPLLPADPVARAHVRAFAQVIACEVHPLQNLRVLNYLRESCGQDQADVDAWCQRWIGDGLAACEGLLAQHGGAGRYCFGDTPGLADICLMPQLFGADRFGVDLTPMPRLRAIRAELDQLPAFAEAHPSRQPDAD